MIKVVKRKVLLKLTDTDSVTSGGIIFQDSKSKTVMAEVVSVGDMVEEVRVNDTVIILRQPNNLRYNETDYILIEEDKILAVKLKQE